MGGSNGDLPFNGYRVSVRVDEKFWKQIAVMVIQHGHVLKATEL